jgi:hypothetical protein
MSGRNARRFWTKVDTSGGLFACWPWQGAYNRPGVNFKRKHQAGESRRPVFHLPGPTQSGIKVYAHRFSLSLYDGVPVWERTGLEACHTCGNFRCVNPAHLYWGTPEQNRKDRYGST